MRCLFTSQGNLEKVAVVIKDKEDVALERFVFAIDQMIQIEAYDKHITYSLFQLLLYQSRSLTFVHSVDDAMKGPLLGQWFRSFLIKLNAVESQLGQMYLGGALIPYTFLFRLNDSGFVQRRSHLRL